MATISIEYGKMKSDGSCSVMLRIRSAKTEKRLNIGVTLEKAEYKIYPDGRRKITNDDKYFLVQDLLSDYTKKFNAFIQKMVGYEITAEEIYSFLTKKSESDVKMMNFFDYADKWLAHTDIKGKKNYVCMLNDLARYNNGSRTLPFAYIDFSFLSGYSMSLKDRPRAQSLYLGELRHIYKQACLEYNTETEIVLSPMLFDRFKVPKQRMVGQRALDVDTIRKFFAYKPKTARQTLAQDACMLSVCLMGTNSVDLYNATYYKDGIFAYERTKTKDRRNDRAYIEIAVHERIKTLFVKYKGKGKHVFDFSERYGKHEDFNRAINIGLKEIASELGIDKLQFYQFRHSVATIARNDLHYAKSDIDEMLNHVGDNRIADIYIKKDFSVINEINKKVINYIFQ